MILSAVFLMAYTIYNAFFFFGLKPGSMEVDSAQLIIRDLLFAIPHLYLLIVLFDYFRYHRWKVLQYTLLFTVIFEFVSKAFRIINQMGSFVTTNFSYSMTIGAIWLISIIVQAIFLLRLKRKDYPEVFSLQKYAVALIFFQLVAFGIPFLFRSESVSSMLLIIRILSAIPYLFLIEFALKLKSKENIVSDSRISF